MKARGAAETAMEDAPWLAPPAGRAPRTHVDLFRRHAPTPSIFRILVAAVESFAKKGFHASTTRDIAGKAGLSPAAVYVHFRSKEEVLYAIALIVAQWVLGELQAAAGKPGNARARLERLVRVHVACHASMHLAVHVANDEFQALKAPQRRKVLKIRDATESIFHDCLRDGHEAGEFVIDELRITTITILSLGVSVSRWFSPRGHLSAEALGNLYARMVGRIVDGELPAAALDGYGLAQSVS